MAKKPVVKRTRARRGNGPMMSIAAAPYAEKKSVRITEADNGFTVCMYGPKGETSFVAKSEGEALRHAKALLGGKK